MHVHLREGDMLDLTVPATARTFSGALVMPNLKTPITTIDAALRYKEQIEAKSGQESFTPYMTLFFKSTYTRDFLAEAKRHVLAVKLYPEGVTTGSGGGVKSPLDRDCMTVYAAMEELGIPLCVHGETPAGFVLEREVLFAPVYDELARAFPKLKIVMEHITTKKLAVFLDRHENVFATVTLHHLLITLDDVIGDALSPHNFCKPVAKTPADREALRELALAGHPKLMFGSDSAPHTRDAKESCCGAAGIFHAPIALQMLAGFFEKGGRIDKMQGFVSDNAARIYGIEPREKSVVLEKKGGLKGGLIVPESYGNVVPFRSGEALEWSVKEIR